MNQNINDDAQDLSHCITAMRRPTTNDIALKTQVVYGSYLVSSVCNFIRNISFKIHNAMGEI